jgi:hypothetical protein
LTAQLATFHSALIPQHVAGRARALSCAGCHQISGLDPERNGLGGGLIAWPNSLGFVQVSEAIVNAGLNYATSPALTNLFLVNRMTILENFLANQATAPAAHQTCPLPFPNNLQVVCPIPSDVQPFPVSGLRALEPAAPFAINGFTPN